MSWHRAVTSASSLSSTNCFSCAVRAPVKVSMKTVQSLFHVDSSGVKPTRLIRSSSNSARLMRLLNFSRRNATVEVVPLRVSRRCWITCRLFMTALSSPDIGLPACSSFAFSSAETKSLAAASPSSTGATSPSAAPSSAAAAVATISSVAASPPSPFATPPSMAVDSVGASAKRTFLALATAAVTVSRETFFDLEKSMSRKRAMIRLMWSCVAECVTTAVKQSVRCSTK
mmetsp:Transcript_9372/g.24136  ORF Transcript_9372/g.24136 Transcript_9372/m.24136 type:complete len:229 (+) Transcript_9372:2381-3067(+)